LLTCTCSHEAKQEYSDKEQDSGRACQVDILKRQLYIDFIRKDTGALTFANCSQSRCPSEAPSACAQEVLQEDLVSALTLGGHMGGEEDFPTNR
jgi:hypothetical protein